MKESKFIELLNLYVDHQISAEDAASLEAEVRSNPERRRVYRQYCQMQKACVQLGDAFRSEAPAAAANVVEFAPRRRSFGVAAYAASFAAVAAAIAVAFVVRSHPTTPATDSVAQSQVQSVAPAPTMVATAPAARPALQPVLGPRSFKLREQNAELADASATELAGFGDWMNDVRLSSMEGVSIDDLRFDGRTPLPSSNRANRTVRPFQGKLEMAALRFQK